MSALLWRMLYAVVCVVIFFMVFPLFMSVVGFTASAQLIALVKVIVGCLAVLYVLFGPQPPTPF